jgi:hypothetical protein
LVGYDFLANSTRIIATDVNGISFTTYGNYPGSIVTQAGAGYEIQTQNDVRLRLNYDFYGRSGYSNNMLNFNLIVPF